MDVPSRPTLAKKNTTSIKDGEPSGHPTKPLQKTVRIYKPEDLNHDDLTA